MAHIAMDPRVAKTAEVVAHATVALDGQANAMKWLQEANPLLGNRSPLQVAYNGEPDEVEHVHELLSALENGIHL
ncbi:MAG: DUF2384 domain-containing protein [Acidobacteriaceae bacterium]|nr:DUF2384 domain-containing protein [Acidobacteriaceae bacterium]MBV9295056.1 DUF2384 domain-containing protein [Acidobacteriaceae bacterium]MBV9767017.1 DUF2384 domain-containing protein [Acidobacteriaceae bacterium]